MSLGLVLVSGAVLVAGWVLYPLVLAARTVFRPGRFTSVRLPPQDRLPVSIVVATREPPSVVASRAENLQQSVYPPDLIRIVVAVDAKAEYSLADYQRMLEGHSRVMVVGGDAPGGKAAALNAALRETATDLVFFADSAQHWEPEALPLLVAALSRPGVGGVTGALATASEQGLFALYWRYESWLRNLESRHGTVVGVTGAIHGLRRQCWQDLPPGLICDDLLIALRIGKAGYAVTTEPRALALDARPMDRTVQLQRKVRNMTGVLQVCRWEPWVLQPVGNPLWLPFLCHKLIRIVTPYLLVLLLLGLTGLLPVGAALVSVIFGLSGVTAVAAWRGWGVARTGEEALWAVRLLLAPVQALRNAWTGRWDVWRPHQR